MKRIPGKPLCIMKKLMFLHKCSGREFDLKSGADFSREGNVIEETFNRLCLWENVDKLSKHPLLLDIVLKV